MKTNIKRVVNILLSVAMIISLCAALAGMAFASQAAPPVLDNATAVLNGDSVTLQFSLTGVNGTMASLRTINKTTGKYAYLNQLVLENGVNKVTFPVEASELNGATLQIIVAAATGTGTKEVAIMTSSAAVDKAALTAAIKDAKNNIASVAAADKAALETAIAAAEKVEADKTASQGEVEKALKALKDAIALLHFEATGIAFVSGAMITLPRTQTIGPFNASATFGGGIGTATDIVWVIGNPALLRDNGDNTFTALNKTGSCTLTAYDKISEKSYSVVIKIT